MVDGVSGAKATTDAAAPNKAMQGLGQDAFLQLLVTKLKNQDPTKPQSDTEFLAELAQFSALEQLMQLNQTVTALSEQIQALTGGQQASTAGQQASTAGQQASTAGQQTSAGSTSRTQGVA
jgi:flagellar basal-body rod modification protein FlgD